MTEQRPERPEVRLRASELRVGYGDSVVLDGLDVDVLDGTVTAVIDWNRIREIPRLAEWYESGWQVPAANQHGAMKRPSARPERGSFGANSLVL